MTCKPFIFMAIMALPSAADAQCRTANTGATCITVPQRERPDTERTLGPAPVEIGTVLPRGRYTMVMNAKWYGLPPAKDGWVYFRVEDDVYRVDYETRVVLERATSEAAANWP
ncbi:MAG: hypothetical protein LC676_01750 [Loktanella sp.]|nr:hypothetical protein [Loktanella sp.]